MSASRPLLFGLLLLLALPAGAAFAPPPDPDQALLCDAGLADAARSPATFLREFTRPPAPEAAALVRRLGSDSYQRRQSARRALLRCGGAALPALEAAARNP